LKKNNLLFFIFLISLLIAIIISPAKFISAGLSGISAWTFNVLPAVLPFMIISQLLIKTSVIEKVCSPFSKPFVAIYKTSPYSFYVFFVSIISGYPVGSKLIADLYEQNKITQADAYKMSSFCSNSGPMFIVGAVGVGMLANPSAGYIILASHIISALINGLIYRNLKTTDKRSKTTIITKDNLSFGEIIENSCRSILSVGAIIMFFFIIIEFVSIFLGFLPCEFQSVIFGIIEITKGCKSISQSFPIIHATILSTIIITFGGISTAFQSISLLKRVNMPLSLFIKQKITQSVISGFVSFFLCLLFY